MDYSLKLVCIALVVAVLNSACGGTETTPEGSGGAGGGQSSSSSVSGSSSGSSANSSSSTTSSSSGGSTCEPITKAEACGESECGLKPDNCGGGYWCGETFSPYCDSEGKLLCLSSGGTPGKCAATGTCLHLADMDDRCGGGSEFVECNKADGYTPGACAPGTGICQAFSGDKSGFHADAGLSCCTPCVLP